MRQTEYNLIAFPNTSICTRVSRAVQMDELGKSLGRLYVGCGKYARNGVLKATDVKSNTTSLNTKLYH